MCLYHSVPSFLRQYVSRIVRVVIEKVLSQYSGAFGFSEDREVFFPIPVAVRHVFPYLPSLEILFCLIVKELRYRVALCLPL